MGSSLLDNLPAEIKTYIFYHIPDFPSLKSLVLSSPSFHAIYRSQRKHFLSTVIQRCVQLPVMVDAIAFLTALRGQQERTRLVIPPRKALDDFLSHYHLLRAVLQAPVSLIEHEYKGPEVNTSDVFPNLAEDDLIEMAHLHHIVLFLTSKMANDCCQHRPNAETLDEGSIILAPSESFRIQRAFYRLEIFRLLFNTQGLVLNDGEPFSKEEVLSPSDQSDLFLTIFSPWEMEEIQCIREFIYRVYETLPGASDMETEFEKKHFPGAIPDEFVIDDRHRDSEWSAVK
ncbi:hypothetical protein ASPWEDRAFT_71083 [Aspergillus wentii DTO 134E9]|uniref:F-box domain-containing protein n=1 Tax=Aspergillus wentii DTO 134E9 TaxID=1073089 RepID=A0A1L9RF95_ASPWE|nr:uncharacterized protein ASPWEDRAFT_71083 [Aspergillus wentii DTO 134E9]OJJ33592.1 hypothetical protein ASPWEDRAFT_71083 [Aspergillus wentii DTO 134E9]